MTIEEYFEALASEHKLVQHSDAEPHFASSMDEAATLEARRLHYPAIFCDGGDFQVSGTPDNYLIGDDYRLAVVTHVQDSGNEHEKSDALKTTRRILIDIIGRMVRDKRKGVPPIVRFDAAGIQAIRVENVDAGLYGWLLLMNLTERLSTLNCNDNLDS